MSLSDWKALLNFTSGLKQNCQSVVSTILNTQLFITGPADL